MSRDFKKCLEKKSLYRSEGAKGLFKKELVSAGEDLEEAKWARALRNAMSMREDADYSSEFSRDGAETTVKNAEGLLMVLKEKVSLYFT